MSDKRRNLKLSDLERRVKLRRHSSGKKSTPVMKSIGSALQKFNQSFTKSVSKMPTGQQINKDLWG